MADAKKPTAGEYGSALNRLIHWKTVLTGWQLGSRPLGDPESDAVRHHRELSLLLRAEVNALTGMLIKAGVFTAEEFDAALEEEAELLSADYARRFPGFVATDEGLEIDPLVAMETTKGWRP
jgi:hypothetical protein